MKHFFALFSLILLASGAALAQEKGIDNQTKTITENKKVTNGTSIGKAINWGKGKTKVRERLSNPYRLNSKRDLLIDTVIDVLESNKLLIDDDATRKQDGIIVTQPYTFAKGAVITQTELGRYATLPNSYGDAWSRARYTLTVEIQSIDGNTNNVSVTAKVEGRTEGMLGAEWSKLPSSGEAEDIFLAKLIEAVTGINPDDN